MKFYYINSNGERVNLYEYPYILQDCDLLDYTHNYEKIYGTYRNRIKKSRKDIEERRLKIAVLADYTLPQPERKKSYEDAANHLLDVFEYDNVKDEDGKLYTDTGYYLPCRIIASKKSSWNNSSAYMINDFTVLVTNPLWIKEDERYFFPGTDLSSGDLDYDHDYAYDYASQNGGIEYFKINHHSASEFEMTIFGPCVDPCVIINGNAYRVNVTLEKTEYLIINSMKASVTLFRNNNTTKNIFDLRGKEDSVFKRIEPGRCSLSWSGDFGFNLKLYIERGEPTW